MNIEKDKIFKLFLKIKKMEVTLFSKMITKSILQ